jgi:hypothetical protein
MARAIGTPARSVEYQTLSIVTMTTANQEAGLPPSFFDRQRSQREAQRVSPPSSAILAACGYNKDRSLNKTSAE